jgi:hypothetical protein
LGESVRSRELYFLSPGPIRLFYFYVLFHTFDMMTDIKKLTINQKQKPSQPLMHSARQTSNITLPFEIFHLKNCPNFNFRLLDTCRYHIGTNYDSSHLFNLISAALWKRVHSTSQKPFRFWITPVHVKEKQANNNNAK